MVFIPLKTVFVIKKQNRFESAEVSDPTKSKFPLPSLMENFEFNSECQNNVYSKNKMTSAFKAP